MNYYPFHIGDYLSATRHLSWEEDAAYRRLLDTYYTTEKPLPADLRAVCRLVLATTDSQREAVRVVLEEFFQATDDGWRNSRADAEIDSMRQKQQTQRDKANKRWHKPSTEHGNASALPQHTADDAAASKTDADAMPPTPTPTPTMNTRESASAPPCPSGVDPQVWRDWLTLRKGKKAAVTPTVIASATAEAAKAGMSLDDFLRVWCARGSQGLQADWLKPHEIGGSGARASPPTAAELRVLQATPRLAAPHLRHLIPAAPQQRTFEEPDDAQPVTSARLLG
jgi:uncharacterized protein YdaU (DUF1376 family)